MDNVNMNRTRKFERISSAKTEYQLPKRSTKYSAGYDFFAPYKVICKPHEITRVRTGVKVKMLCDEVLLLYNRSSNPRKKGLVILNGVGVVDADYYNNEENEGEMCFEFYNITDNEVIIEKGDKLGQGVFTQYYLTDDDIADGTRTGGFGSTGG